MKNPYRIRHWFCRMVAVDFEISGEIMLLHERNDRRDVKIILVLGGLHRFRFDQESAIETLGSAVVARFLQEGREVVKFALHVGVKQRKVAFSATPKNHCAGAQFHT